MKKKTGNVGGIVVSDAGPLIGLAVAEQEAILQKLYGTVWIPPEVHRELQVDSELPGAGRLAKVMAEGWLRVEPLSVHSQQKCESMSFFLDSGEAQAILLAEQVECRFLLIDERRGRRIARNRGVPVVGVAGVLIAAKRGGVIDFVLPILDRLAASGYRLSRSLYAEVARLCGECVE